MEEICFGFFRETAGPTYHRKDSNQDSCYNNKNNLRQNNDNHVWEIEAPSWWAPETTWLLTFFELL